MSNSSRQITLNCKHVLKTIEGNPLKENASKDSEVAVLGKHLGNVLVNATSSDDPIRTFRIATDLHSGGKQFSITEDDLDYIIAQYKKVATSSILVRGQILEILNDAKILYKKQKQDSK